MRSARRLAGALLLALSLGGCGFHLPQHTELPPEMARVRLDVVYPDSTFARRLLILLEQSGIEVGDEDAGAAVLLVTRNRVRKEILTIGDNARVREYRLRHTVEFTLLDAAGETLVPSQSLEQSRVISFDEQDILGAAQEDEQLRREMADTLARLVLRRLGTVGG